MRLPHLVIGLIAALFAGGCAGASDAPVPPASITTVEHLRAALEHALGESNRNVRRLQGVSVSNGIVTIEWALNDNFGTSMIRGGAEMDAAKMLRLFTLSQVPHSRVQLRGTFAKVDAFGQSSEDIVIRAAYTRDALTRINWNGFDRSNVFQPPIATHTQIHPEFRE